MKKLLYLIVLIVMILLCNVCLASEIQSSVNGKDINGNGIVNSSDLQRLYTHLNGTYPITDENTLKTADINQNGEINSSDLQSLYMFLKTSGDSNSDENEDNTQTTFNLAFDVETSTLDLGEDWQKYRYKYVNDDYIYTPSQRILTKNAHNNPNAIGGDSICIMLSDDLSKSQIIETPDVFESVYYNEETKCIELGDDWNKYTYISIPSSTLYNDYSKIYTPNYRKSIDEYGLELKNPTLNSLVEGENGDNTFNEMYVLIALKANHEVYRRISVPSMNLIRYDIETGSIDLGENWENYRFSYGPKGFGPYEPSQRTLFRNDHYYLYCTSNWYENNKQPPREQVNGTTFGGECIHIEVSGDSTKSIDIDTPDYFDDISYNEEEETLDLGENWEKYAIAIYDDKKLRQTVPSDYIPTKQVIKKYGDILEEGEIGLHEKLYAYVRLKTTGRVYKIILLRDCAVTEIPEITYDEETATIDLGKYWRNYQYSYSDISGEFGTIYDPQTQVIERNENYKKNDGSLFKGKYVHIILDLDEPIYRVIEIPDIFTDVLYDEETQILDLGADWEKYIYIYSDKLLDLNSHREFVEPIQKTLTKVSEITEENLGKSFAGKYVYVLLNSAHTQYKIIYIPQFIPGSYVYDSETASVDLGKDWRNLKYSYNDVSGDISAIYTPSQRFLTRSDYAVAGNGYSFNKDYLYILNGYDTTNYFQVEAPNPFANVKYDTETKVIDLGEDFDRYYYTCNNKRPYNVEDFNFAEFYEPEQRYISKTDGNSFGVGTEFCGSYVYVILKNNINSYKQIYTPSDIPELVFDIETGTVDLGPNYREFTYSYSDISGELPSWWKRS